MAVPSGVEQIDGEWLSAVLGHAVGVEDVTAIGEAHGFVSTVARVRGTAIPPGGPGRPLDLVVKLTEARRVRREEWFLRSVGPRVSLRLPGVRFAQVDDEVGSGAIGMDHVVGDQGDVLEAVDPAVVFTLVDQLAALHVPHVGAADPVLDAVRDVDPPRFLVRPASLEVVLARAPELLPAGGQVLRVVAERADGAHEHLRAGPRTLVHGDAHLDNVLLTTDGPVLLDWENTRIGTAVEDVAPLAAVPAAGGTIGLTPVLAAHRRAVRSRGGTIDPELDSRAVSALIAMAAGVTNFAGRVLADPTTPPRQVAAACEGLRHLLQTVHELL